MTSEVNAYNEEGVKKKKVSISVKIIIFLVLLLAAVSGVFYFYYQNTQGRIIEYNEKLQEIENLQSEQDRCSTTLSKESGNFGDYEYCLQLLQVFPK